MNIIKKLFRKKNTNTLEPMKCISIYPDERDLTYKEWAEKTMTGSSKMRSQEFWDMINQTNY